MSEVVDSILQGLNEALEFAQGEKTGAIVHIPNETDKEPEAAHHAKSQ